MAHFSRVERDTRTLSQANQSQMMRMIMKMQVNKPARGFTLIELMIVVAVVAILAAIAYPSYADYVKRGKIPAALAELSNDRIAMEQYFMDNRAYKNANNAAVPNACAAAGFTGTNPQKTIKEGFTITCTITNNTAYTITATGGATINNVVNNQMLGFGYTIDQAGNKVTTSLPTDWKMPDNCPAPTSGTATTGCACWVIKSGSCGS
jgi:type IV pilus assembly protein PilE